MDTPIVVIEGTCERCGERPADVLEPDLCWFCIEKQNDLHLSLAREE